RNTGGADRKLRNSASGRFAFSPTKPELAGARTGTQFGHAGLQGREIADKAQSDGGRRALVLGEFDSRGQVAQYCEVIARGVDNGYRTSCFDPKPLSGRWPRV